MRQQYTFKVVILDEGDEHCETFNAMDDEQRAQLEESIQEILEMNNWEADVTLTNVEIQFD